jgi:tetratricopeptide (TPR) repeat protein
VSPALALVRCCVAAGDLDEAKRWAKRASQAVSRIRLPVLFPLSQVAWALAHLLADRYDDARKRLIYPLEYMLLLEDTSPQEIYALRSAAACGLGDELAALDWLAQAAALLDQQAQAIDDAAYRETFLNRVPLHRFIRHAAAGGHWQPADVFNLSDWTGDAVRS